jgi:hypothetical protein
MLSIACCSCKVQCIIETHLLFQIKTESVSKNIMDGSISQSQDDCRTCEQNTCSP